MAHGIDGCIVRNAHNSVQLEALDYLCISCLLRAFDAE